MITNNRRWGDRVVTLDCGCPSGNAAVRLWPLVVRGDILEMIRIIDLALALPEDLENQLWADVRMFNGLKRKRECAM